jgi:GMP synthase-like glutamine amidotransferase
MKFAIIDNNIKPMLPDSGRGLGFVESLAGWVPGRDYEFIRYDHIAARADDLRQCHGLILSGSGFDFARPDDEFDRDTYEKMVAEFRLLRDYHRPVLGICFGHQLLALVEEFDEQRTSFGDLRVNNMREPEDDYLVVPVPMHSPFRFLDQRELWVQHNHKQEVTLNAGLRRHFDVVAGTARCPVTMMQHKTRDWFGVQFHPEVGRDSKKGEIGRHSKAVEHGYILMRDFVHYCLE